MSQFLTILFGVGILYLALTSRMRTYIQVIALQGFILFLLIVRDIGEIDWFTFFFLAFETLAFKTIIVPAMLWRIVARTQVAREADPHIPQFGSIVIGTVVFLSGFAVTDWVSRIDPSVDALAFGIAVSTLIIAFFIILTRKKLITQVMGYMLMQNAVALLMIAMAVELPLLVNLGVLLDIFTLMFLFLLFLGKLHSAYEETSREKLTSLRDQP
jgi:hydrogenase-4 component E